MSESQAVPINAKQQERRVKCKILRDMIYRGATAKRDEVIRLREPLANYLAAGENPKVAVLSQADKTPVRDIDRELQNGEIARGGLRIAEVNARQAERAKKRKAQEKVDKAAAKAMAAKALAEETDQDAGEQQ